MIEITASLQKVVAKLEAMFSTFNDKYYDGKLQTPVITVSPDVTSGSYGWCTTWKAWKREGTDGFYEINITAEHLSRPFKNICATMLHEMVHLWNLQNGVKDTSRGFSYHNKLFKNEAEIRGLSIEHDDKYGWTKTSLNQEASDWLEIEFAGDMGFDLYRTAGIRHQPDEEGEEETKKKSSSRKYCCPECGMIVRATKEVRVSCMDCDIQLEEEIK